MAEEKTITMVLVEWVDSKTNGGWHDAGSIEHHAQPSTIFSLGYLFERDEGRLVMAQSFSEDTNQACNILTIPKGAIVNVTKLDAVRAQAGCTECGMECGSGVHGCCAR